VRALGRIGRLTKRRDFLAAAAGRRFHSERMTLQGQMRPAPSEMQPEETFDGLRVGLTVTKRVGHATERNRIKRRLRAALREAGLGAAVTPADVVVIARRHVLSADYRLLVDELERGLRIVTRPKPPSSSTMPAARRPRGSSHA